MFDFEKLEVYQKAKVFNHNVLVYIKTEKEIEKVTRDQLRRASLSIMLNIAEGSSRFSKADRKNFFIISRGSVFECVAIFDFLLYEKIMQQDNFSEFYVKAEELSKILFALIRNLELKS